MTTPSPPPPPHEREERFPRIERLLGKDWDDEDAPDCFEKWFGASAFVSRGDEDEREENDDNEEEEEEENAANSRDSDGQGEEEIKPNKSLLDSNWVKRKMDEEVWRFVQEAFEAEEETYWMRFRTALAVPFALIAVGIHFIPLDSGFYRTVSWVLIYVFLGLFATWIAAGLLFAPLKTIVELKPNEKTGCGFFVESELDRLKLTYEVKMHNHNTPRAARKEGGRCDVPEARSGFKLHFNRFFTAGGEFASEEFRDYVIKMRDDIYKQLGVVVVVVVVNNNNNNSGGAAKRKT